MQNTSGINYAYIHHRIILNHLLEGLFGVYTRTFPPYTPETTSK